MKFAASVAIIVTILALVAFIMIMGQKQHTRNHDLPSRPPIHSAISLVEITDALTAEDCGALMTLAEDRMAAAKVVSADGSVQNTKDRQSEVYWMSGRRSAQETKLAGIAQQLTGLKGRHLERLQIARYSPGGFYRPHYDTCNEPTGCKNFRAKGGNRHATLLVYLNDDFEGGQTHFPLLGESIQPRQGKAVFFKTTDLETGRIIEESLHEGKAIQGGHKWIANLWIREEKI